MAWFVLGNSRSIKQGSSTFISPAVAAQTRGSGDNVLTAVMHLPKVIRIFWDPLNIHLHNYKTVSKALMSGTIENCENYRMFRLSFKNELTAFYTSVLDGYLSVVHLPHGACCLMICFLLFCALPNGSFLMGCVQSLHRRCLSQQMLSAGGTASPEAIDHVLSLTVSVALALRHLFSL